MQRSVLFILGLSLFLVGISNCTVSEQKSKAKTKWFEEAIWYSIFPDRFRNGDPNNDPIEQRVLAGATIRDWSVTSWTQNWFKPDLWMRLNERSFRDETAYRRFGGDLQGVIDQLDYLQDLGITAIWFNPVFDAQSLHRYDASAYHHIDRFLGPSPQDDAILFERENPANSSSWEWSQADQLFLTLIKEAHSRGIKIILDGVFNHTGRDFWAFRDIIDKGSESNFVDWYHIQSFDDPNTPEDEMDYDGWWGIRALPELAENENGLVDPVKEHLFAVTKRWMDPNGDGEPEDGIDGWRLDVAEEVNVEFWKDWNEYVHQLNPDAYTTAESWSPEAFNFMLEAQFDGVMNYSFAFEANTYWLNRQGTAKQYVLSLDSLWGLLPSSHYLSIQNLFDSHDTARLISMISSPVIEYDRNGQPEDGFSPLKPDIKAQTKLKQMLFHLYTMPGAPLLYYGTESGMWGADDPHNRKPMLWPDLNYESETYDLAEFTANAEVVTFDSTLWEYTRQLIEVRKSIKALSIGKFEPIYTDKIPEEVISYSRTTASEQFWVLINPTEEMHLVSISDEWKVVSSYPTTKGLMISEEDLDLSPHQSIILKKLIQ